MGSVLVSFLSLMYSILNDSNFPIARPIRDGTYFLYTPYGNGMLIGFVALGLTLGVAVLAGVNAALAADYVYQSEWPGIKDRLRSRMVLCLFVQFAAAVLTGVSILLLIFTFDKQAAAVTSMFYFAGVIISVQDILFPISYQTWKKALNKQPLVFISFILSIAILIFTTIDIDNNAWMMIPAVALTFLHHLYVVLRLNLPQDKIPMRRIFYEAFLCILWAIGSGVTLHQFLTFDLLPWATITQCVCGLMEAIVFAAIGVKTLRERNRYGSSS